MRKPSPTRRAKPADTPRAAAHSGSTFIGILIGLVLGLTIALGVAWYINKLPNPFNPKPQAPSPPLPVKAETPAAPAAKVEPPKDAAAEKSKPANADSPKGDSAVAEKAADGKSTPAAKETFFLQTGSFQNAPEADNLKARLALLGVEASIQTRTLPEKGVWHRVRVGPYADMEELNRVRGVLTQNGIDVALVRVREADK